VGETKRKVNIGVVGCAVVATAYYFPYLMTMPDAELVAVCDLEPLGDVSKARWPQPIPGGFNYYHVSTQHLVDCILQNLEPVVGIEFGLHVTEMMWGALESSRTGQRYTMTTQLPEVTHIPEVKL
jgi:hypothetical protein